MLPIEAADLAAIEQQGADGITGTQGPSNARAFFHSLAENGYIADRFDATAMAQRFRVDDEQAADIQRQCNTSRLILADKDLRGVVGEQLGRGSFRTVYRLGDRCVLKVDNPHITFNDNFPEDALLDVYAEFGGSAHEWNNWMSLPPNYRRFFVPSVAAGRMRRRGFGTWQSYNYVPWLVQRFAAIPETDMGGLRLSKAFEERLRAACVKIRDIHPGNVAAFEGRPVIVDYAPTMQIEPWDRESCRRESKFRSSHAPRQFASAQSGAQDYARQLWSKAVVADPRIECRSPECRPSIDDERTSTAMRAILSPPAR